MKKFLRVAALGVCAACVLNLTACGGKATRLGEPADAEPLSYQERLENRIETLAPSTDAFAAAFSAGVYESSGKTDNFVVSPIAAYMALSTAVECAGGSTRQEILSALGVSYEALSENFSALYRAIAGSSGGDSMGRTLLGNSVWLNEGTTFKSGCIDALAEKYFCYSFAADFAGNNQRANLAIKDFVKEQTKGLINRAFALPTETVFTLINTLYLKDIWNLRGNNLPFAEGNYDFTERDGDVKSVQLLQGYYNMGRVYDGTNYTQFYTKTHNGYKIKFILPKDGYTVDDIFTAETLDEVNAADYIYADDDAMLRFYTRCLFPEFKASYDGEVGGVLRSVFGIQAMFDPLESDFSNLTDEQVYCGEIRHATELKVTKKGIEGASVFVIPGAGAAGPDEYTEVYEDFVVNGAFGFVLTDKNDIVLFSGVVGEV